MLAKSYNYLLKIEYDGSSFVGWQYQKNGISVQEKIEKALSKIFNSQIRINGAGRTDKGVHALGQYANFKVNKKIESEKKFLNTINFFLKNGTSAPKSIAISAISSLSVLTKTISNFFDSIADFIVHAIIGLPKKSIIFLLGILLLPDLAGIIAILSFTKLSILRQL